MAANQSTSLEHAWPWPRRACPGSTTWSAVAAYTVAGDPPGSELRLTAFAGPGGEPRPSRTPTLARRVLGVAAGRARPGRPPRTRPDGHVVVGIPVLVGGAVICVIELLSDEVPLTRTRGS